MDVALLVRALRRGLEGVDDGFRVVVDGANLGGKDLCGWRAREVEQPCDQMLDSCWLCLQMSNADRRFYDL